MALKTDYKADVFEGNRKYLISQDGEGKSEIQDVTVYSQEGDVFGPDDINLTNKAVNALNHVVSVSLPVSGWSVAAPYTQTVSVEGLTAEDSPILVKVIADGATPEQVKAYNKAFGMIDDGDTADGQATFKCYNKKPTIDMTVGLKGV
ncbi:MULTISPECIES: hypothetical protein [unclassified Clostridium]|jgi:hypothetical protein|uniref:hypothetical protein n=1 Tax=unclassified Clostridium TaxID=2614128 RepID=UPI0011061C05|nr:MULTISPECIES: hypothetical protein [unclassified Clostridium]DAF65803.1 MAG TPA: hypothetical protein [Caudoviricetes sp.]